MTDLAAPTIQTPPNAILHLVRRARSIADMRGFWSLSDQAILSAGNFLTSWLLLRGRVDWYGNYYTVLTFILFLNNLHMALMTYPLMVTPAGTSDSDLRRRIRRTLGMTLLLLIPESLAVAWGTSLVMGLRFAPWAIAALIFWQLQETTRRALMARLEHRRAIIGDLVSYFGQVALIGIIIYYASLSAAQAFALIAITSSIAFIIQALQLRLFAKSDSPPHNTLAQQARHHWKLGQWLLLTNIVNVLTCYSIPWTERYYFGKDGVTAFSAVVFLLNASNPLLISVSNLITPVVARIKTQLEESGKTNLRPANLAAVKYTLQGALILLPYFAILLIFPGQVMTIFFKANSPYLVMTGALRAFTVAYTLMYVSAMLNAYLCGLGKSHLQFYGQVVSGITTVLIALPLTARYSVLGAAWGTVIPVIFQVMVGIFFVRAQRIRTDTIKGEAVSFTR